MSRSHASKSEIRTPSKLRRSLKVLAVPLAIQFGLLTVPGRAVGQAFLGQRLPVDARQTATGGLHPSGDTGASALRSNPAALAWDDSPSLTLSHRTLGLGLRGEWVCASLPTSAFVVAADVSVLHAGDLPRFDEDGTLLGSFSPREVTSSIGVARRLGDRMRIGGAARLLHLDGGGISLSAYAFDAGLQADFGSLRLGVCARNLGGPFKTDGADYRLPTELAVGITRRWWFGSRTTLTLLAPSRGGSPVIGFGADLLRLGPMALLGGCTYDRDAVDGSVRGSAGIEMGVGGVRVAYAYSARAADLTSHHLSVSLTRSVQTPEEGVDGSIEPTYSVWGGIHRDERSAKAEVRALAVEGIEGASLVQMADGRYRIRLAQGLDLETAENLASRCKGTMAQE